MTRTAVASLSLAMKTFLFHGCATFIATLLAASLAWAQGGDATRGRASGTARPTPVLPKPEQAFGDAKIGRTYKPRPKEIPAWDSLSPDQRRVAARLMIGDNGASMEGAESFDVGMDAGSPVSEEYRSPFAYAGTIRKVQIRLAPSALSASDQEKVRHAARKAAMTIE